MGDPARVGLTDSPRTGRSYSWTGLGHPGRWEVRGRPRAVGDGGGQYGMLKERVWGRTERGLQS